MRRTKEREAAVKAAGEARCLVQLAQTAADRIAWSVAAEALGAAERAAIRAVQEAAREEKK